MLTIQDVYEHEVELAKLKLNAEDLAESLIRFVTEFGTQTQCNQIVMYLTTGVHLKPEKFI
ncbi:MAG: hypothetical protein WC389_08040 [Lutibacter sp.]|jgi:hypothetical protein